MRPLPGLKSGATIGETLHALSQAFAARGIDSAQADARILVADALNVGRATLIADSDRQLDTREIDAVTARAARRLAREPVARILGVKEFWSLPLRVEPSVLVPRPDTETVVEAALEAVKLRRDPALRILDIGTGSGAILLALLSELPNASGVGTDISAEALAVARGNAERLQLAARATFIEADIAGAMAGPFDIIVSNPPYIRTDAIAALDPDVRDYDPRLALDGGADGLDIYRRIASAARSLLASSGWLVVELGQGQEDDVASLFNTAGLVVSGAARQDLGGISRALSARAP